MHHNKNFDSKLDLENYELHFFSLSFKIVSDEIYPIKALSIRVRQRFIGENSPNRQIKEYFVTEVTLPGVFTITALILRSCETEYINNFLRKIIFTLFRMQKYIIAH